MAWDISGKAGHEMEWILLTLSLLLFLGSAGIAFYTRNRLVRFTGSLTDCLDAILAGEKEIDFQEDAETLMGKVQVKIRQLYEVMEMKSEENFRQRQRLESMISDISHQVKTPLSSIRMYNNLLKRKEAGEDKREEFLSTMERQVDKLDFFMQSMIRMSRLEAGIIKVTPRENSVHALIAQAVCDIALKAEEKNMAIEVDCDESLSAYFDSKWTAEAIVNILDNSVKYTKPGGMLTISAEKQDDEKRTASAKEQAGGNPAVFAEKQAGGELTVAAEKQDDKKPSISDSSKKQPGGKLTVSAQKTDFFVRIKIADNGRGIAQSRLPDIFKRFYREPESKDVEGVGIGLYLAREIIMQQRGFIEVRSQKGIGTQVYVNLPVAAG